MKKIFLLEDAALCRGICMALEGLLYTLGSALLALALVCASAPFAGPGMDRLLWFFSYRFTLWPVAVILPLFVVLGAAIPVAACRATRRRSVVDRLRVE